MQCEDDLLFSSINHISSFDRVAVHTRFNKSRHSDLSCAAFEAFWRGDVRFEAMRRRNRIRSVLRFVLLW